MINTTFGFLVGLVVLTALIHLLLLPRLKSGRVRIFTDWLALTAVASGLIIAIGEMRGLQQTKRFQDLDAFMQSKASNARGRAEEMIVVCRRLVEMSGGTSSAASAQFQEAQRWAEDAASDLRSRYETDNWRRFLQKHSTVKRTEDPVIQQLKLPILSLLVEMEAGRSNLEAHLKSLKRRGQLLWLAPLSPWLLVVGFGWRIAHLAAEWRSSSLHVVENGKAN